MFFFCARECLWSVLIRLTSCYCSLNPASVCLTLSTSTSTHLLSGKSLIFWQPVGLLTKDWRWLKKKKIDSSHGWIVTLFWWLLYSPQKIMLDCGGLTFVRVLSTGNRKQARSSFLASAIRCLIPCQSCYPASHVPMRCLESLVWKVKVIFKKHIGIICVESQSHIQKTHSPR